MNLGSFAFMFFKNMDAGNGHQYDHYFSRVTVFSQWGGGGGGGGGGELPIMASRWGGSDRKEYLFPGFRFMKG